MYSGQQQTYPEMKKKHTLKLLPHAMHSTPYSYRIPGRPRYRRISRILKHLTTKGQWLLYVQLDVLKHILMRPISFTKVFRKVEVVIY